jgi:NTP pyrophosphatase (non-canonical NTP hydrolase)
VIQSIKRFLHRLRKSADNERIISSGFNAVREVLRLDKNLDKPLLPHNVKELLRLANGEMVELIDEVGRYYHNPERIRAECGNVIAYLSGIADTCERDIRGKLDGTV